MVFTNKCQQHSKNNAQVVSVTASAAAASYCLGRGSGGAVFASRTVMGRRTVATKRIREQPVHHHHSPLDVPEDGGGGGSSSSSKEETDAGADSSRLPQERQTEAARSTSNIKAIGADSVVVHRPDGVRNVACSAVRILPGSYFLCSNKIRRRPPSPRTESPPPIQHEVKLVLVGPSKSGKTSLCQSWVRRQPPEPAAEGGAEDTTIADRRELSSSSVGGCWYHKDVTYCQQQQADDEQQQIGSSSAVSIRVHLCDTTSPSSSCVSPEEDVSSFLFQQQLVNSRDCREDNVVDGILICVPLLPTSSPSLLYQQVRYWEQWVHDKMIRRRPAVMVLLTQADRRCCRGGGSEQDDGTTTTGGRGGASSIDDDCTTMLQRMCDEGRIRGWNRVTSRYDYYEHPNSVAPSGLKKNGSSSYSSSSVSSIQIDAVFQSIVQRILEVKDKEKKWHDYQHRCVGVTTDESASSPQTPEQAVSHPAVVDKQRRKPNKKRRAIKATERTNISNKTKRRRVAVVTPPKRKEEKSDDVDDDWFTVEF